jgi:hypothetical protein
VIPVIYGKQRVKLTLIASNSYSSTSRADFWYVIGEGPIDGTWTGAYAGNAQITANPNVTLTVFPGSATESMDGYLNSSSANVSRLPRTAHLWMTVQDARSLNPYWENVFPGGQGAASDIVLDIKGLKVYDPRLDSTVAGGSGAHRANNPATWAWSDNPALCIRDFICDPVHGCGVGHSSGFVNDVNIIAAANACDTLGFKLNIALTSEGDASAWLDQMRLVCNGTVYVENGQYCLFIDQVQSAVVVDFTTLGAGVNARDVSYQPLVQRDQPTRVIVEFPNAAKLYKQDTVTCDNPGVATGAVTVREARYKADGITNEAQAWKVGCFIANKAAYPLRVDFLGSFVSHKLKVGSLITLVTDEGLGSVATPQKCLVEALEEQLSGEAKITARIYFDAIYSATTITGDTPPSSSLPNPNDTPPDVTMVGASPMSNVPALPSSLLPQTGVTTDTATRRVVVSYLTFDYQIPTSFPWANELVIRWDNNPATFGTATWASMAANELVIPLGGNMDAWAEGGGTVWLPGVVGETTTTDFAANGQEIFSSTDGGEWRVILRVRSYNSNLSAGVTVSGFHYASSSSTSDPGAVVVAKPLTLIEQNLATLGLSAAGEAYVAMDLSDHAVKVSVNGGAWTEVGGGGGSSPLTTKGDIFGRSTVDARVPVGADGKVLTADSAQALGVDWKTPTTGTVTSVAQSVPSNLLAVSGSPVTGAGTLALTMPVRAKNTVLAGPATGADAEPAFRALVPDDVTPGLPLTTKGDLLGYSTLPARLPVGANGKLPWAESAVAMGIEWRYGLVWIVETPTGVIDGSNRFFTLSQVPESKVFLTVDNQQITGGRSWGQSGTGNKTIQLAYQSNPPRNSIQAAYMARIEAVAAPPDVLPVGTASTWTGKTIGLAEWQDVAWSPELGLFAAIRVEGTSTDIYTSPDGMTWTAKTTPTTPVGQNWKAICWSAERGEFMATGQPYTNVAMYSSDGETWTQATGTGDFGGEVIIWVRELALYIGIGVVSSQSGSVATSPDGLAWTGRYTYPNPPVACLGWAPALGLLVAMGQNHVITSSNGVAWNLGTPPNDLLWHTVAWSPELGRFCAGSGGGGTATDTAATSPDGLAWTTHVVNDGTYNRNPISVVWSRTRLLFVAGFENLGLNAASSPDGETWTFHTTPAGGQTWFLAVGDSIDTIVGLSAVGDPRAMVSTS